MSSRDLGTSCAPSGTSCAAPGIDCATPGMGCARCGTYSEPLGKGSRRSATRSPARATHSHAPGKGSEAAAGRSTPPAGHWAPRGGRSPPLGGRRGASHPQSPTNERRTCRARNPRSRQAFKSLSAGIAHLSADQIAGGAVTLTLPPPRPPPSPRWSPPPPGGRRRWRGAQTALITSLPKRTSTSYACPRSKPAARSHAPTAQVRHPLAPGPAPADRPRPAPRRPRSPRPLALLLPPRPPLQDGGDGAAPPCSREARGAGRSAEIGKGGEIRGVRGGPVSLLHFVPRLRMELALLVWSRARQRSELCRARFTFLGPRTRAPACGPGSRSLIDRPTALLTPGV